MKSLMELLIVIAIVAAWVVSAATLLPEPSLAATESMSVSSASFKAQEAPSEPTLQSPITWTVSLTGTTVLTGSIQSDVGAVPVVTETHEDSVSTLGEPPKYNQTSKQLDFMESPDTDGVEPPSPGQEIYRAEPDEKTEEPVAPLSMLGWTAIMTEGFEGAFPNGAWTAFDNDGTTNGEYYWDDDDYKPYNGYWSAWAANGGANALDPQYYNYPNRAQSWMIYGPFSLSDATNGRLRFYYWNQSELNYDYFGWYASANGTNFYGTRVSGDSGGWRSVDFDLTAVPGLGNLTGDSSVWIAFVFTSDGSITNKGPFVDNVVLEKYTNTINCPGQYKAEYFNNRYLSGNPTFARCEDWPINWNWGTGGPGNGVGNDNFSVRWTGTANISAGSYDFIATADDGIRVWLDNALIIDAWRDQPPTTYTVTRNVAGGNHNITVEYYENAGGAVAQFRWQTNNACPPINAWMGEYWNNQTLSGSRTLCRDDSDINFDWGTGSPNPAIPNDHFSARWTRTVNFSSGRYRFHLRGDDGIRLWVDNVLVIDQWHDQGPTEYTVDRNLTAGNHGIKVEYYENSGGALVRLWWELTAIPGIDYHTRSDFHVFKIDLWSSNLSFEMVMASDSTNVNQNPSPRERVSSMVNRNPYVSRNPVLAFNADYFAPDNTHGPEGLTVKNGTRFDGYGATPADGDGNEWKRSSISISSSRTVRIGKQTDCSNNCVNWHPSASAYYNTAGGGPLFIDSGQRIGGTGSPQPCTNEFFTSNYCSANYIRQWTAVGVSQNGRYLIVVVSGANKNMDDAANVLIAEGAFRAMKLDGGSSTQVWYKNSGSIVNGASGVANAIMVFSTQ